MNESRIRIVGFISTHAPHTGSDLFDSLSNGSDRNFNPRSPHGERRRHARALMSKPSYFNPRSPHGERPNVIAPAAGDCCISTHAPHTGSDAALYSVSQEGIKFQPTLPTRGATRAADDQRVAVVGISTHAPHTGSDGVGKTSLAICMAFQPTLPARGATPVTARTRGRSGISTHAPRTGSDPLSRRARRARQKFQPTLPARGATVDDYHPVHSLQISTHAPRTGSDLARALRSCR